MGAAGAGTLVDIVAGPGTDTCKLGISSSRGLAGELRKQLARDRPRTTVSGFTQLGLVEMTRKRTRESLNRTMHETCFYCDGTGQIQSRTTIAYETTGTGPALVLVDGAMCYRGSSPNDALAKELQGHVSNKISPIARPKSLMFTPDLPKTRSGKILRGTMQKIADKQPWNMPETIDDPAILGEIKEALETIGYADSRR